MFYGLLCKNNATVVSTSGKNLLELESCNLTFSDVLGKKSALELAPLIKIALVAQEQKGHWDLVLLHIMQMSSGEMSREPYSPRSFSLSLTQLQFSQR